MNSRIKLRHLKLKLHRLRQRQYNLMPLAENERLDRKVRALIRTCRELHHAILIETSKEATTRFIHHLTANKWCIEDQQHGRPRLVKRIAHVKDIIFTQVGEPISTIRTEVMNEYYWLHAHGYYHLADDVLNEARNDIDFIDYAMDTVEKADEAMMSGNLYKMYCDYYKLAHIAFLASKKPSSQLLRRRP